MGDWNTQSLQGHFLVASSRLVDPNFYRSVIFLIQHDIEGALGVVITRPTNNTVGDLWEEVCGECREDDGPVFWGGPVSGPVLMLHTDVTASQDEILPGLYLAADRLQLEVVLNQEDHEKRLFVGYSGWSAGQLESEMSDGSWLPLPGDIPTLFSEDDDLWEQLMHHIGDAILSPMLQSVPVPEDPSLN